MTRQEALKKLLDCCGAAVAGSGDPEVKGLCESATAIIQDTDSSAERDRLIKTLIEKEGAYIKGRKDLARKTSEEMQKALMAFADTLDK